MFETDLAALEGECYPGLRVVARHDDRDGLLTADAVTATSDDLEGAAFYLCGARAMTEALTAQLVAAGVPSVDIRFEKFRLDPQAAR